MNTRDLEKLACRLERDAKLLHVAIGATRENHVAFDLLNALTGVSNAAGSIRVAIAFINRVMKEKR